MVHTANHDNEHTDLERPQVPDAHALKQRAENFDRAHGDVGANATEAVVKRDDASQRNSGAYSISFRALGRSDFPKKSMWYIGNQAENAPDLRRSRNGTGNRHANASIAIKHSLVAAIAHFGAQLNYVMIKSSLKAYVDYFLSQTDAIPLTPNDTRGVYLLFFDGGSRGNPGPGGTGSIIVRVHKDSHTASLIWAASMAYSRKDTTNNFAEYWGLIHGLREAQRS
ncbi:hypothetical protein FI667_g9618, partial [Globisporangium splendens]